MANTSLFRGSGVAIITPFHNGQVDIPALRRLVEYQIAGGTAAIIACGTTGEPATLTAQERETVIAETVAAAAGRVPVICGTGSNCTQNVIDSEKCYRGLGCAAQLVVTPYYNKTTQEGLYAHFMAIADNTQLPIYLYNVPSRTGLDIAPETLRRLVNASDHFIALKESSFNLPFVMEKLDAIKGKLALYSGNDEMVYPLLSLGAQGVISIVANALPAQMSQMVSDYFAGNPSDSLQMQLRLLPLIHAFFAEVSPIPCKHAMEIMGLCEGELRLPLIDASEGVKTKLRAVLTELGVL